MANMENKALQEKALRMMELAMQINASKTRQDCTGGKPTVFVSFAGHVAAVQVDICTNGWGKLPTEKLSWNFYLDFPPELAAEEDRTADEILLTLERIARQWGVGDAAQTNETED